MLATENGTTLRLSDGRTLGYAQYGAPGGTPVFFFHGWGASRLTRHPDDAIAARLGARLIAPDRPGIGLSSDQRRRAVLDWPADVAALADALHLDRFSLLGWSGGASYVAACAYRFPERVQRAGIVSGTPPLVGPDAAPDVPPQLRRVIQAARLVPWLIRGPLWQWRRQVLRDPEAYLRAALATLPAPDRAVAEDPRIFAMLAENTTESYRQGIAGLYMDSLLLARPWGFRLADLTPEFLLWQGEADTTMVPAFGRYLAGALPRCQATFFPGEGHYALFTHWGEILAALVAD